MNARKGFAKRLTQAREATGLTLAEAAVYATQATNGGRRISHSTIQRMEVGMIPEDKADPIIVAALARVYGRDIETLSADAASRLVGLRELLVSQLRWIDELAVLARAS